MEGIWGGIQIKCPKCGYVNDLRDFEISKDFSEIAIDGTETIAYKRKVGELGYTIIPKDKM